MDSKPNDGGSIPPQCAISLCRSAAAQLLAERTAHAASVLTRRLGGVRRTVRGTDSTKVLSYWTASNAVLGFESGRRVQTSPCLADWSRHQPSTLAKRVRFPQHGPCPRLLTDRIRDYESHNGGSNPSEGAIFWCSRSIIRPPPVGGYGGALTGTKSTNPPCGIFLNRGSSTGQSGRLLPGRLRDRSPPPTP